MATPAGRPKALILSVYGAYVRALGGWLAVSDLVTLMGELGIDEQAVRSAVSRMVRRGLLAKESQGDQRGYRLTDEAMEILADGDRRIYSSMEPSNLDDGWGLVSFSVPESERDRRHVLRSRLTWLGFGNLSSGLWIAPRRMLDELQETVKQLGFEQYVDAFIAHYVGFDDLTEVVRKSWDLESIEDLYRNFLEKCTPILRSWEVSDPWIDQRQAFVDYTQTLHHWRKFPYLDPGLPPDLLPPEWDGRAAAEAFHVLRERLSRPATRYVEHLLAR